MTNTIKFHGLKSINEIRATRTKKNSILHNAKTMLVNSVTNGSTHTQKILTPQITKKIQGKINKAANAARINAQSKKNSTSTSVQKAVNAAIKKAKKYNGLEITPCNYLKLRFKHINHHPTSKKQLPAKISLTQNDLFRAGINCGYEPTNIRNTIFTKNEKIDLLAYQIANYIRTMSVLDCSSGAPTKPKKIFDQLETTDKGGMSFQIGSLATYLTAEAWILASGDTLDMLLHERLYSKALSSHSQNKQKHADFVAITTNKQVHLFESKGGIQKDSYESIVDGLVQLEATARHISPVSYLCVHASIKGGSEIDIVAFDPPDDGTSSGQNLDSILDLDYLRIAQAANAIDAFNALLRTAKSVRRELEWVFLTYQLDEEIRIVAPKELLMAGDQMRCFLDIAELAKDVDNEDKINPQKTNTIISEFMKILGKSSSEYSIYWYITTGRDQYNTIKELEDRLKAIALYFIQDTNDIYSSHNFVSPLPQPTKNDFFLTNKGLIPAKREFTTLFNRDII